MNGLGHDICTTVRAYHISANLSKHMSVAVLQGLLHLQSVCLVFALPLPMNPLHGSGVTLCRSAQQCMDADDRALIGPIVTDKR